MSYTFVISNSDGKYQKITTRFNPPLQLDKSKRYEMALVNLETYWSFPNISEKNNQFKFTDGVATHEIFIETGGYELVQLNAYIQTRMEELGYPKDSITIKSNPHTLKAVLEIKKGFVVIFTEPNSIASLLGFSAKLYGTGNEDMVFEGQSIVKIISLNSIYVMNSLCAHSYIDGELEPILYSFFPRSGLGEKIIEQPHERVYSPITLDTISSMQTWLTDQNGVDLDLRQENLTIRFHLREIVNTYFEKMVQLLEK